MPRLVWGGKWWQADLSRSVLRQMPTVSIISPELIGCPSQSDGFRVKLPGILSVAAEPPWAPLASQATCLLRTQRHILAGRAPVLEASNTVYVGFSGMWKCQEMPLQFLPGRGCWLFPRNTAVVSRWPVLSLRNPGLRVLSGALGQEVEECFHSTDPQTYSSPCCGPVTRLL